jgi:predicted solute-binding protein
LDKEIEAYIELSFIEWNWYTNKEHAAYIKTAEKKLHRESKIDNKDCIKAYLRALRMERAKFRKYFADQQYKFTQKTMVQPLHQI